MKKLMFSVALVSALLTGADVFATPVERLYSKSRDYGGRHLPAQVVSVDFEFGFEVEADDTDINIDQLPIEIVPDQDDDLDDFVQEVVLVIDGEGDWDVVEILNPIDLVINDDNVFQIDVLDGNSGEFETIDFQQFTVPEPTILALFAPALIIGFLKRRS